MKKNLLFSIIILLFTHNTHAQATDYKVVFDISTKDSTSQQAVVREVDLIKSANPAAKLEVVLYGQSLNLVTKGSKHAEAIQRLITMPDVSFKVCEIAMARNHVEKSQLLDGIQTVPDGIYEIITKEREGWGYIKVAH